MRKLPSTYRAGVRGEGAFPTKDTFALNMESAKRVAREHFGDAPKNHWLVIMSDEAESICNPSGIVACKCLPFGNWVHR